MQHCQMPTSAKRRATKIASRIFFLLFRFCNSLISWQMNSQKVKLIIEFRLKYANQNIFWWFQRANKCQQTVKWLTRQLNRQLNWKTKLEKIKRKDSQVRQSTVAQRELQRERERERGTWERMRWLAADCQPKRMPTRQKEAKS